MSPILSIGDKVDVQIQNPQNPDQVKTLYSQVMNADSEFLYLGPLVSKGIEYPISPGQEADLVFFKEEGVFRIRIAYIKRIREENATHIQVKILSNPKKTQRREYFRLKYLINGSVKSLDNEKSSEILIQDISGGGVKAISPISFYTGEKLEVTLYLDENTIHVAAVVVRSHRMPDQKRYETGIMFKDVSDQNQDRIIGFIFQKQGELRKKGLI